MVSSIREKIYEVEKQKKIQRRISKQIDDDMKSSFISVDSFNNKNQRTLKPLLITLMKITRMIRILIYQMLQVII